MYIPSKSPAKAKVSTPGYVLDVGTVSDPSQADILNVSSKTPIDIPISYGRRAIFGCVIWSGNFKVAGSTTGSLATYCDFAVAFGYPGTPADEIEEVQLSRIWIEEGTSLGAGGRLIYDRTTPGGYALSADLDMTIYDGSELQEADELIVKAEGVNSTPPMRGLIYVVFRKFNLAKYGLNSIPQFRAELVDITDPTNYYLPFEEDGIYSKATLTFTNKPTNNQTVTIDGQAYTFVAGNANTAYKVKIGDNISATKLNLVKAINATGVAGVDTYGVGTVVHPTVSAQNLTGPAILAKARTPGTSGNSINVSETLSAGSWSGTHLSGALSTSIDLPDTNPIGVDWQRNRVYMVSTDSGHYTLRIYDLTTMREIMRGAIKSETGTAVATGSLNPEFLWQVDEATGTIYTTLGGTANNVTLVSINPTTQRITSRYGHISLSFPAVRPGTPTVSFPARMRFATTTLGYGPCSGTRRYAIVATLFDEVFIIGLNTDGTLVGPISFTGVYTDDINDIAVQDSIFTIKSPVFIDGVMAPGSDADSIRGIRAYVAAGNKLYSTFWSSLFPTLETPRSEVLLTLTAGYNINKLVYNKARNELLIFYVTNTAVQRVRRYTWVQVVPPVPTFEDVQGPGVFTSSYDKIVPAMELPTSEVGQQYSKLEMGQYGYQSSVAGHAVAVVLNSQDGRYKTYPMEVYVEYNDDFATNEEATTNTFDFIGGGGSLGAQPFCAAGGYFIGRPTIGGGTITAGLMYVNGILNFRVLLSDLLRWLGLSAGYTNDQIEISDNIDDKILGCIIEQRTDIFSLIEALGIVFNFKYFESEEKIKFVRTPTGDNLTITAELTIDNIAPTAGGEGGVIDKESFLADMLPQSDTPDSMALTFIDFTNDYQPSTVKARKSHFPFSVEKDQNEASYSIPIIMVPSEAVEKIYRALYLASTVRLKAQFRTGFEHMRIEPADAISLNVNDVSYIMSIYETTTNDDYSITMGGWTLATDEVNLEGIEDDLTPIQSIVGSYITETIIIDSSLLTASDEPIDATSMLIYIAAFGYGASWPGATIFYGLAGDNFQPILNVIGSSGIGYVTSELIDTGLEHFTDEDHPIEIQLVNPTDGAQLVSITDDDLLNSNNRALVGVTGSWEVIQYRDVTDNGNGSFTLNGIIRGRRNTEHNMGAHSVGCYFIPIISLFVPQRQTVNETTIGEDAFYTARNDNQETILNVPQEYIVNGNSRKPWSPTDYTVSFDTDHFVLTWARRTKTAADLEDDTGEVPLEFDSENFEIDIYDQYHTDTIVNTITVAGAETANYDQTDFETDAFPHTGASQTILNPAAEAFTADWTGVLGSLGTTAVGHTGRSFTNTISPMTAYQDIAIDAGDFTAVDAGSCKILISWYQDEADGTETDTASIDAAFYDGTPGSLISASLGTQSFQYTGDETFIYQERIVTVPALTRTIRLTMNIPSGSVFTVFIDDITLDLWTLDSAPPTMKFAVYQISDDTLIGRGEGVPKTMDIIY